MCSGKYCVKRNPVTMNIFTSIKYIKPGTKIMTRYKWLVKAFNREPPVYKFGNSQRDIMFQIIIWLERRVKK